MPSSCAKRRNSAFSPPAQDSFSDLFGLTQHLVECDAILLSDALRLDQGSLVFGGLEPSDSKIGVKRLGAPIREGDDTLLAAFGVKDADAPLVEIEIGNVDADQLRATDAGIEEDHQHRPVSEADL